MPKILIIRNSHSVDAFRFPHHVYKDKEQDGQLVLGILYYSGCSITQRVDFYKNNEPVCDYYKNTDGNWAITKKTALLENVLKDEKWDKVFLQAANHSLDFPWNLPA